MADWGRLARRIRVPLGFVFAAVYIWFAHPSAACITIGTLVALTGLAIRAFASGHVEKNQVLAVSGPYAYTRNPLYLGSIVLAAGFLIAARSWLVAAIALILLVAIYLPVIRSEEAFLRQRFPEFEAYSRQVPRLLPRLRPHGSSKGSFSWDLYFKHREYNAALGMLCMTAVLVVKLVWFTK
ncbi:MAG TPA: isoprenylcysteine carboxylmethyltransferase family protein [Terriglobales bacterium]|nr:isoprenylcysteine carboxylmethyltransferase family protein [Terriglobales bacterium]